MRVLKADKHKVCKCGANINEGDKYAAFDKDDFGAPEDMDACLGCGMSLSHKICQYYQEQINKAHDMREQIMEALR